MTDQERITRFKAGLVKLEDETGCTVRAVLSTELMQHGPAQLPMLQARVDLRFELVAGWMPPTDGTNNDKKESHDA